MGAYFGMGAYKQDVVIVIKIGAYIHGCLFCVSTYYRICILFSAVQDVATEHRKVIHVTLKLGMVSPIESFFLPTTVPRLQLRRNHVYPLLDSDLD